MTATKNLEKRIQQLEGMLARLGMAVPREPTEKNPDYIAHGSPQHAALLGLIEVDNVAEAKKDGYITFVSPSSGKAYRLEDQITPFMSYPDPGQVAKLVLQQKVSNFESGTPKVPADAPPLWMPD